MAKRGQKQPKEAQRDAKVRPRRGQGSPKGGLGCSRGGQREAKEPKGKPREGQGEAKESGQERPREAKPGQTPKQPSGIRFWLPKTLLFLKENHTKSQPKSEKRFPENRALVRVVRMFREKAQPSQGREASPSQAKPRRPVTAKRRSIGAKEIRVLEA